ncbi:MAG: ribosomal subunit interface protein [Halieaceae bacterium]|nr:ribosomal subunit interface protein [Halieaceae bacterium]
MNLTISGHHITVTSAIREHVVQKLAPMQRHGEHITRAAITLIVERNLHKAEANLHVAGGELFASSESKDMYAAIDALADKLDRQVIKHKEKHRGH